MNERFYAGVSYMIVCILFPLLIFMPFLMALLKSDDKWYQEPIGQLGGVITIGVVAMSFFRGLFYIMEATVLFS